MLFLPEFPWSDLHTLNLDWLLSVVANHERQLQDLEGSASPYDEAPLQDGAADPGNVNQFARGNHRHPTDTTRASVAALQAVQDTVPGPSNGSPRMDGTASPGTYTYYSRADHVHPSDTSKLDKTGGEVDGVLDIVPRRSYANLSRPGWYRVLTFDLRHTGSIIELYIGRQAPSGTPAENHKISFFMNGGGLSSFVDEKSLTSTLLIDKIRVVYSGYTGFIDIHYVSSSQYDVSVYFDVYGKLQREETTVSTGLVSVADSPSGETVLTEYTFEANTFIPATRVSTGLDSVADSPSGETVLTENTFEANTFIPETT